MARLTGLAALTYLTRPDGMLIVAGTVLIALYWAFSRKRSSVSDRRAILAFLPLGIPVIHLLWRHTTYGEWLPNTYYAKYVAPWPEAGGRYLASFVLEYALWMWLGVAIWVVIGAVRSRRSKGDREWYRPSLVAYGTIAAHLLYYTLIIGGDHFEYRIYSYLIPFIFLSFVGLLNRVSRDPVIVACLTGLFVVLSWPVPWTHWAATQDRWSEAETRRMFVPIAEGFPSGTQWYAGAFDHLQAWLIDHSICARHQAHKAFALRQERRFSERSTDQIDGYPVMPLSAVGVAGWRLPHVAIIDVLGLNDYVIARGEVDPARKRVMAHERTAPPGYIESWPTSYTFFEDGSMGMIELEEPLTAEEIIETENYWRQWVQEGDSVWVPARMQIRQGEYLARKGEYAEAAPTLLRALARAPGTCGGYALLAVCYMQLEQPDSALMILKSARRLQSCSVAALERMGRIAVNEGFRRSELGLDDAAETLELGQSCLEDALALDSTRGEALIAMASVTLFRNLPDSSAIYLDRLEHTDDLPIESLRLLAERYKVKGQTRLAEGVRALMQRISQ